MDKKSLDEFFAQADDVLTNWPVKNVNDSDAANTEDPGRYVLGDEDGTQPRCLGDLMTVVFFPSGTQGRPELMMVLGFDPAGGAEAEMMMARRREDGTIEVVDTATGPAFDTPAGPLTIPPGSINLAISDSGDENIANHG